MKHDFPLYEGDGFIRYPGAPVASGQAAPAASLLEDAGRSSFEGPYVDFYQIEKRARLMRSKAMGGMFARMFDWIEASVRRAKYRDLERYLGESTDLADLERRLRRMGAERRGLLAQG